MRPIKFRFWNKLAYRFQPPSKYAIDGEGKLVSYDYEVGAYDEPIDFSDTIIVPQQYTGLKDKNGKEVYEGDIVKAWNQGDSHIGEIRWRLEAAPIIFIYPAYHDGKSWFLYGSKTKEGEYVDDGVEVIGNIFENLELLKK